MSYMTKADSLWSHPNGRWKFRLRTWECCGLMWELFLSKNYPGRETWGPTCPKCGGRGL